MKPIASTIRLPIGPHVYRISARRTDPTPSNPEPSAATQVIVSVRPHVTRARRISYSTGIRCGRRWWNITGTVGIRAIPATACQGRRTKQNSGENGISECRHRDLLLIWSSHHRHGFLNEIATPAFYADPVSKNTVPQITADVGYSEEKNENDRKIGINGQC